jgi:hypothetical protein
MSGPVLNEELATALALIEASNRGDDEAARVLLAGGDLRNVALCLAWIAVDLLTDLAEWGQAEMPDLLMRQRQGWLSPARATDTGTGTATVTDG